MQEKIQGEGKHSKEEFGQYILYLKLTLKIRISGEG